MAFDLDIIWQAGSTLCYKSSCKVKVIAKNSRSQEENMRSATVEMADRG